MKRKLTSRSPKYRVLIRCQTGHQWIGFLQTSIHSERNANSQSSQDFLVLGLLCILLKRQVEIKQKETFKISLFELKIISDIWFKLAFNCASLYTWKWEHKFLREDAYSLQRFALFWNFSLVAFILYFQVSAAYIYRFKSISSLQLF